ncbi:MAG: thioredoxin domain-containing protein [Phototrophicaceae bacterium]
MNRLQHETSPYLLQHKANPVDWYPWGEEALQKAQAEDKPILLSVGYSACHWCHVMEHESFEDDETAQLMNQWYVCIKVDREERPDLDDIYMQAVQAMTGQGGWPMTVFLTPDGRPFYGGTYYPKEPRMGMPSFKQVLSGVYDAYANRRDDVEQAASKLTGALDRTALNIGEDAASLNAPLLDAAAAALAQNFDWMHGGFGGAPKFPQPMNLEFLLRNYMRTGEQNMLDMVRFTLERMARGGIYDQIGGGFARYSVDAQWLVPHFEKMLYDNAQLSRVYLHTWQVTKIPLYRHIAEEIYDYILREMTAPEGGFYSATDADSEGEEGKFFVWSKEEIESLLGDDAPIAIDYWDVTAAGNFEGANILYVPEIDEAVAERLEMPIDELRSLIARSKDTLYAARTHRVPPGLDDKILTSWNGMMLASLAEAARVQVLEDQAGEGELNGYLEDYANLIDGLLELYQTTFDDRWFVTARRLAERVLAHFRADDGGFFDTSDDHESLIVRPRNVQDNATPSGNAMMAKQLVRLYAYTGDARYETAASDSLRLLTGAMRQYPQAFAEALNAVDMLASGLAEIAIVGQPASAATRALLAVTTETLRPNLIVALSAEDVPGEATIPLLSHRTQRDGQPTVYVCRNFACRMPVTTPEAMRDLLA